MRIAAALAAGIALLVPAPALAGGEGTKSYRSLQNDKIVNADVWSNQPEMLAAGLGFTDIIGVPGLTTDRLARSEALVRDAGGAWNTISCAGEDAPRVSSYTSASTPSQVSTSFGWLTTYSDGLPVEFSMPIRPSRLGPRDFEVTLSNGETVTPALASIFPNMEFNERSVAVLFGTFGNRIPTGEPGAVFPVETRVVRDDSPLQLIGPDGPEDAVGLSAESTTSPYSGGDTGPRLAAAKLSRLSTDGENAPIAFRGTLPNDGRALYGDKAKFRLRVYTTGGFSPDGVRAVFPTEFERYFRLHTASGKVLTEDGKRYRLGDVHLKVLGLADLGRRRSSYDDCYREDRDNYIDIVLGGDKKAAAKLREVEIPATGGYDPFYNPGGPGNDPTPGVEYTAPGPSQLEPIFDALDDPATVSFFRRR